MSEAFEPTGARARFVPIPHDRVLAALAAWGIETTSLAVLPRGANSEVFFIDVGGRRLVAKYAYMERRDVEPGLLAAEAVSRSEWQVATPLRTVRGELTVMIEWPNGSHHPLALLDYVAGMPLNPRTNPTVVGDTLGRVQATLLEVGAERLALRPPRNYLGYLCRTHQDLGEHAWLHNLNTQLIADVDELTAAANLTIGPGVWDGPEIVIDNADPRPGLIDFGNVDIHPIAHVLAYGITQVSPPGLEDHERAQAFIDAFSRVCKVSDADVHAIPTFRRLTLAIYAKFMATRRAAGRLDTALDDPLNRTLIELHT